jgi:hypothetical protein
VLGGGGEALEGADAHAEGVLGQDLQDWGGFTGW